MSHAAQSRTALIHAPMQRFALGAVSALGLRVASAGLAFVLGIVLARSLGFTAYGDYAFAAATVQLLAIIAKLGLDNTSLRFAAQYKARNQDRLLHSFINYVSNVGLFAGGGAALLVVAVTCLFRGSLSMSLFTCLLVAAALLVIVPLTQVREATLLALGRVVPGMLSPVVTPVLLVGMLLLASHFTESPITSSSAMLLHVIAALVAFLLARAFLSQSSPPFQANQESLAGTTSAWISMALPMMLVNLLIFIQGQSGTIFSGLFLGTENAGLYSAVSRMAGLVLFGLQSISTVAAPRMAALYAAGETDELQRFVRLCAWAGLAFALPIALCFALFGRPLLLLFGPDFVVGQPALLVLLLGLMVNAATGSVAHLLYMTGHHFTCLRLYAAIAAATLLLHVILIPRFGIMGAAVTTSLVQAVWNLALVYLAKKKIGVWSTIGIGAGSAA
jgi:O-antigen/teichoic acid export membrane protein